MSPALPILPLLLCVTGALPGQNYLGANQRDDGCWSAAESGGVAGADLQTHAWALLAHLGDGSNSRSGSAREKVALAIRWLHEQMDARGRMALRSDPAWALDQALATYALVEDVRLGDTAEDDTAEPARRAAQALSQLVARQRPAVGAQVRFWSTCVASSVERIAGSVDEPEASGPWTTVARDLRAALHELPELDEPESLCERAAAALLTDPRLDANELAEAELPPLPEDATEEPVAAFYGALLRFRRGGAIWKETTRWLQAHVVASQQVRVPSAPGRHGSWEPGGEFGKRHGRIGTTAVNVLSLEIYYRYCRLGAVGG